MSLKIISPTTKIKIGEIQAIITGVWIQECNYIQYELSYWLNGEHKSCWIDQSEIDDLKEKSNMEVGFL